MLANLWALPTQPYSRREKWCWRLRPTAAPCGPFGAQPSASGNLIASRQAHFSTITRLPSGSPALRSTSFRSGAFGVGVGTAHSTEQHCIRYETHADACAPFGFGFAESTLRFASAHFPAFSADSQALNTAHLENRLFQLPKGENQCLSLYLSGSNAFCHSKNG